MLKHNFHFGTTFPYRLRSSVFGAQLFRRTFCYPLNSRSVHTADEPVLDIHLSDSLRVLAIAISGVWTPHPGSTSSQVQLGHLADKCSTRKISLALTHQASIPSALLSTDSIPFVLSSIYHFSSNLTALYSIHGKLKPLWSNRSYPLDSIIIGQSFHFHRTHSQGK